MPDRVDKDPSARLDYGRDWSGWLKQGDALASSSWSASPAGLVLSAAAFAPAGLTSVFVSGGGVGASYRLTNHVVTVQGREDDRSILVKVKER